MYQTTSRGQFVYDNEYELMSNRLKISSNYVGGLYVDCLQEI